MTLDPRTLGLIAVGASVAANCRPCLERAAAEALASGADRAQVAEAIDMGRLVRRGAASVLDRFASELGRGAAAGAAVDRGCECSA